MSNKRFRSAVSGKFVTLKNALLHPKTTVSETVKKRKATKET